MIKKYSKCRLDVSQCQKYGEASEDRTHQPVAKSSIVSSLLTIKPRRSQWQVKNYDSNNYFIESAKNVIDRRIGVNRVSVRVEYIATPTQCSNRKTSIIMAFLAQLTRPSHVCPKVIFKDNNYILLQHLNLAQSWI